MEAKKRTRGSRVSRSREAFSFDKMRKSCDACASAKRKCDGRISCSLCSKRGCPCVYSKRQKSGPKKVKPDDNATSSALGSASGVTDRSNKTSNANARRGPSVSRPPTDSNQPGERERKKQRTDTNDERAGAECQLGPVRSDVEVVAPPLAPTTTPTQPFPRHEAKTLNIVEKSRDQETNIRRKRKGRGATCAVKKTKPARAVAPAHYKPKPSAFQPARSPHHPALKHTRVSECGHAAPLPPPPSPKVLGDDGAQGPAMAPSQCAVASSTTVTEPTSSLRSSASAKACSRWQDTRHKLMTSLEGEIEEILCSGDDVSDDDAGLASDALPTPGTPRIEESRGGVLREMSGTLERARHCDGVKQLHQQQPSQGRHQSVHFAKRWSQPGASSSAFMSGIQAANIEYKSLANGGGGRDAFLPGGKERNTNARAVDEDGEIPRTANVVANAGSTIYNVVSPIASWDAKAVEEGATTLLAVLADEDEAGTPSGVTGGVRSEGGMYGSGSEVAFGQDAAGNRLLWPAQYSGHPRASTSPVLVTPDYVPLRNSASSYRSAPGTQALKGGIEATPEYNAPMWHVSKRFLTAC